MTFTIDDILHILFFQIIYVVLYFVLTVREVNRRPRTSLLWLMVIADVLYIGVLLWLSFTISTYLVKATTDRFRWMTLLFSIFIPATILLITFSIYYVSRDIKYKNAELKRHK